MDRAKTIKSKKLGRKAKEAPLPGKAKTTIIKKQKKLKKKTRPSPSKFAPQIDRETADSDYSEENEVKPQSQRRKNRNTPDSDVELDPSGAKEWKFDSDFESDPDEDPLVKALRKKRERKRRARERRFCENVTAPVEINGFVTNDIIDKFAKDRNKGNAVVKRLNLFGGGGADPFKADEDDTRQEQGDEQTGSSSVNQKAKRTTFDEESESAPVGEDTKEEVKEEEKRQEVAASIGRPSFFVGPGVDPVGWSLGDITTDQELVKLYLSLDDTRKSGRKNKRLTETDDYLLRQGIKAGNFGKHIYKQLGKHHFFSTGRKKQEPGPVKDMAVREKRPRADETTTPMHPAMVAAKQRKEREKEDRAKLRNTKPKHMKFKD